MADTAPIRTSDFVSQATLDAGMTPVDDALGHEPTALAILQKSAFLPPGSVIAIQGPWGRGKTDVLVRVATMVRDPENHNLPKGLIGDALWINPWQYGTPDLLTPLVIAMLERIPSEERKKDGRLRMICETLLRAGVNFGMKAVGATMALGPVASPVFTAAADPLDRLIGGLFGATALETTSDRPDMDPVAAMGERFAELAATLLTVKGTAADARILVCVDDLDRCLPDRQVALLEAIRFLISSGAPVTFLIALDPVLARQAILTHYKTREFDPDRYLDKMFDLRVNLPELGFRVADMVEHQLNRQVNAVGRTIKVSDALSALFGNNAPAVIKKVAPRAFNLPDFANPRIIRRIFDRLYLLAYHRTVRKDRPLAIVDRNYQTVLVWLAICERYPAFRRAVQGASNDAGDEFRSRLVALIKAYASDTGQPIAASIDSNRVIATYHLPDRSTSQELQIIAGILSGDSEYSAVIQDLDDALVAAGL
ncbi:MAG: hypothetical protein IPK82_28260 [Polyangiaceae bacterium]|nr:hypothetical protein [Polyangiaceae bacterium]